MPEESVIISTTIETIPRRREADASVCIIGQDEAGSAVPGKPREVENSSDITTYFGTDTDLANALEAALRQGAPVVYGYKVPTREIEETVDVGSVELLEGRPSMFGDFVVEAHETITATYLSDGEFPSSMEYVGVLVNTHTRQILISELNGVGDRDVTYDVVNWDQVVDDLSLYPDIGVVAIAGLHKNDALSNTTIELPDDIYNNTDVFEYSDKASVANIVPGLKSVFVIPVYARDEFGLLRAYEHTVALPELSTANTFSVAHVIDPDNYAVNGHFAGAFALVPPIDKLMWKRVRAVADNWMIGRQISSYEIGVLESYNVNALFKKTDQFIFSNGLSGTDEIGYRWIDTIRTQYLIEETIRAKVDGLIKHSVLPYTHKGLAMLKSTLELACETCVGLGAISDMYFDADGEFVKGYTVTVPHMRNVSTSDIDNRIVNDVEIVAKLPGHIQTVTINMTLLI